MMGLTVKLMENYYGRVITLNAPDFFSSFSAHYPFWSLDLMSWLSSAFPELIDSFLISSTPTDDVRSSEGAIVKLIACKFVLIILLFTSLLFFPAMAPHPAELRLPPKPTTTPTPYVPPTPKQPRRKQHHQSHGKGNHDGTGKGGLGNGFNRDSYIINHIQENDMLGGFASDGKYAGEEGGGRSVLTYQQLMSNWTFEFDERDDACGESLNCEWNDWNRAAADSGAQL